MEIDAAIDAFRDFLDDSGYRYDYNAEHRFIRLGFAVSCKLKNLKYFIQFRPAGYTVYAISPLSADKDNLGEMLKYIAMANYGLANGNFELDVRDGEIRYKCWVSTWKLESLPPEMVDESISIPHLMFKRYGDGIAALSLGFSDAETEIAKSERSDEEQDGE